MRILEASALVALAALPVALFAVANCSNNDSESTTGGVCLIVCGDSNNCPGATMVDCDSVCNATANLNLAAGCGGSYNTEQDCAMNQSDVCTLQGSSCESDLNAYQSCINAYCSQVPTPSACNVAEQ